MRCRARNLSLSGALQSKKSSRTSAGFSIFPQRTRESLTGWRMTQSDANLSLTKEFPVRRRNTRNFAD
jgi:hypothetical protein